MSFEAWVLEGGDGRQAEQTVTVDPNSCVFAQHEAGSFLKRHFCRNQRQLASNPRFLTFSATLVGNTYWEVFSKSPLCTQHRKGLIGAIFFFNGLLTKLFEVTEPRLL